jgi:nucleoside-diphosphate-sugar epimerase
LLRAGAAPALAPGSVYNVGRDEGITIRELVARVRGVVGTRGSVEFGARPDDANELVELVPDVAAARRDLGFVPAVSLEEGIRRTAEWMRQQPRGVPA